MEYKGVSRIAPLLSVIFHNLQYYKLIPRASNKVVV